MPRIFAVKHILLLACALTLAACQTPTPPKTVVAADARAAPYPIGTPLPPFPNGEAVKQLSFRFGKAAFGEHDVVRKWTEPIDIRIWGHTTAEFDVNLGELTKRVSELARHPVRFVPGIPKSAKFGDPRWPHNFLVIIAPRYALPDILTGRLRNSEMYRRAYAKSEDCVLQINKSGNQIKSAFLIIHAHHNPDAKTACIQTTFPGALGLTGDQPNRIPPEPNLATHWANIERRYGHLLRLLYDPRISAGQGREETMAMVLTIARTPQNP